jgi:galactose mutarotase-like enzyme
MEETEIKKKAKKEWKKLVLENEKLRIILLPELGGKMTSLENKETGTQFLKQYVESEGELKPPSLGFDFKPPYAYGFDECFPTVAPSSYLFNERVIHWPDHGELWTQEWNFELEEDRVVLKASGVNLLYEFEKEIQLKGNQIQISYRVKNTSYRAFDYIWSSHPLLEIDDQDELLIDEKVDRVSIHETNEEGQIRKKETGWPYVSGDKTDYSVVQAETSDHAMKLFAEQVEKGRAGLYRKQTDETILFEFDTERTPHLGIWLCYGGWPEDAETGSYTVALEPATASFDKLSDAIDNAEHKVIEPGECHTWNMSLEILSGKAEI